MLNLAINRDHAEHDSGGVVMDKIRLNLVHSATCLFLAVEHVAHCRKEG